MTVHICDRCNEEIKSSPAYTTRVLMTKGSFELCEKCSKIVENFILMEVNENGNDGRI